MMLKPTTRQQEIIDHQGNCVVVAVPGSGKTFTISNKIRNILSVLPDFKGVVAISYTNKASNELKSRCLSGGIDKKSSFFGTIDTFFISEIIIPFGSHLFGLPKNQIEVVTAIEVNLSTLHKLLIDKESYDLSTKHLCPLLSNLYIEGKVILETFGFLAVYILNNSKACQRYIKARYSHIFIDEYQDCGYWQHTLFEKLVNLGLHGVAVGDINQSIFAFAGKNSKYLEELQSSLQNYTTYTLVDNHRCHNSIVNYSSRLLSPNVKLIPEDETRIFYKKVSGSEIDIAVWMTSAIDSFIQKFNLGKRNKVAILVSSKRTGNIISKNLGIPSKPIISTSLDSDSSYWGSLFRKILTWAFTSSETKYELLESYLNFEYQIEKTQRAICLLKETEAILHENHENVPEIKDLFISLAELLLPEKLSLRSVENLERTLSNKWEIESFMPAKDEEVLIMTLHKSKGLEFDIVFHLDLYEYILPKYKGVRVQCRNLHYVGITRAKECCILCSSTQRHDGYGNLKSAKVSSFVESEYLEPLRVTL